MPKGKSQPKAKSAEEELEDMALGQKLTPEELKKVKALVTNFKPEKEDVSAMLGGDPKGKKLTTADRLRTLFIQHGISPVTKILRRLKVEESKIEAYERAENMGLDPKLLAYLPKPDKKAYYALLLQLVRYELPELKSIEMTGQIEAGMAVHVIHHAPMPKVIRVDAGSPLKLRQQFGQTEANTLTVADKATAIPVEKDDY